MQYYHRLACAFSYVRYSVLMILCISQNSFTTICLTFFYYTLMALLVQWNQFSITSLVFCLAWSNCEPGTLGGINKFIPCFAIALVVLICLAFLFLILESKKVILKLCWCRLPQRLHQATLANASEITRSASVQEMKSTISPQFSTITVVLQSSVAACGTSGCEYCLMLSHLEGKLAHPYITLGLKVWGFLFI